MDAESCTLRGSVWPGEEEEEELKLSKEKDEAHLQLLRTICF